MPDSGGRRISFPVKDAADVILGLQRVREGGLLDGADEIDRSMVATIVSELATNIVKYALRGHVRVQRVERDGVVDIEVWAEDEGPGIPDIPRARSDGFSSSNTLGLGLPGVERMSDAFDIQSVVGHGTQVHARRRIVGRSGTRPAPRAPTSSATHTPAPQWDIGMHVRPMPGQVVSGDLAIAVHSETGLLLLIADGTGHGTHASESAQRVAAYARAHADSDLPTFLSGLHTSLQGTAGAAAGAMFIDPDRRTFRYAGVGNTTAARRSGAPWRGVSRDGVLGQRLPSAFVQDGELARGDLFVMTTDGMPEMATGEFAARSGHRSASQLAREAVERLGKAHDDAGCIALRWNG